MKLIGYIKECNVNSFAIPVYSDGSNTYFHKLTEHFHIASFEEIEIEKDLFRRLYCRMDFDLGDFGSIVFVGKEHHIFFGDPQQVSEDIIYFLAESTLPTEYINVKAEAQELKNILYGNILINSVDVINFDSLPQFLYPNVIQLKNITDLNKKDFIISIQNSETIPVLAALGSFPLCNFYQSILDDYFKTYQLLNRIEHFYIAPSNIKSSEVGKIESEIEEILRQRAEERRVNFKFFNEKFNGTFFAKQISCKYDSTFINSPNEKTHPDHIEKTFFDNL